VQAATCGHSEDLETRRKAKECSRREKECSRQAWAKWVQNREQKTQLLSWAHAADKDSVLPAGGALLDAETFEVVIGALEKATALLLSARRGPGSSCSGEAGVVLPLFMSEKRGLGQQSEKRGLGDCD
jgi:hypothetical protein